MNLPTTRPSQTPFEFQLANLTPEVKPLVLRTIHSAISTALSETLLADGDKNDQATEARCLAKLLKACEKELGGTFSSVNPQAPVIRYVSPSQMPQAGAKASPPPRTTRKPRKP